MAIEKKRLDLPSYKKNMVIFQLVVATFTRPGEGTKFLGHFDCQAEFFFMAGREKATLRGKSNHEPSTIEVVSLAIPVFVKM